MENVSMEFSELNFAEMFDIEGGRLSDVFQGTSGIVLGAALLAAAVVAAPVSAPLTIVCFYSGAVLCALGIATTAEGAAK